MVLSLSCLVLDSVEDDVGDLRVSTSEVDVISRIVDVEDGVIASSRKLDTDDKNKVMIVVHVDDHVRILVANSLDHGVYVRLLLLADELYVAGEKPVGSIEHKIVAVVTITPVSVVLLEPVVEILGIDDVVGARHLEVMSSKSHSNTGHGTASGADGIVIRTSTIHEIVTPGGITLLVKRELPRNKLVGH